MTLCILGHTQRAYECPSCGEAATGLTAKPEHWRWYRGRTSSPSVRAKLDAHLLTMTDLRSHEPPRNSGEGTAVNGPMPLGEKPDADAPT